MFLASVRPFSAPRASDRRAKREKDRERREGEKERLDTRRRGGGGLEEEEGRVRRSLPTLAAAATTQFPWSVGRSS